MLGLKVMLKIILITAGALLFINASVMAVITNFNTGVIFSMLAAAALLLCGVFMDKLLKIKWLLFSLCAAFVLLMSAVSFLALYGQTDNVNYTEDAVIVLGGGIKGEQVSLPLAGRLDKAVEYHAKNPGAVIIVSGGQGFQETITEALAMERYLVSKGVAQDKIIKEEASVSTETNFIYSKKILDEYFSGTYTTAFITNYFHIYRAEQYAQMAGLDITHCGSKIQWYSVPQNYLRECAAVVKLWIRKMVK